MAMITNRFISNAKRLLIRIVFHLPQPTSSRAGKQSIGQNVSIQQSNISIYTYELFSNYVLIAFIAAFLSCASGYRSSALKNPDYDCRSKDHVMQITQKYIAGMNRIFNERLRINPNVKGRLVMVFYVQASGLITQQPVVESSSLGDTVLENQFTEYIKTWDYGKCDCRKKTMQIIYPFDFNTRPRNTNVIKASEH